MEQYFQHITLTDDQRNALAKLESFLESEKRVFILKGYAGSGKTTLLKGIVDHLTAQNKVCQLMAPTGRAAKVLKDKTGFNATTIHKGIYSYEDLEEIEVGNDENDISFRYYYKLRNNEEAHRTIFLVDESSMLSDKLSEGEFFRFGSGYLLKDLIESSRILSNNTTSKIIFIGDPAQLPPVNMNFSPALDETYLLTEYGLESDQVEIKEVIRQQSENGILKAVTKIRKSITSGYFNEFDLRQNQKDIFHPSYQDFLETFKTQSGETSAEKKIIITYKNKTALDLNTMIRIDKFSSDVPIQASDVIIIGANNYSQNIMNGEFGVVAEADPAPIERTIRFITRGGQTKNVDLRWRGVTLTMPEENDTPKIVRGYILENYLYGDNYLESEEQRALFIDFKNRHPDLKPQTPEFTEAIIGDPFFNCIKLKYGYAVTCHKAQGGEWHNAFVFWDKAVGEDFNFYESEHTTNGKTNIGFYRWAYTAVTRASKKLYCINPPHFTSFSGMTFIEDQVKEAFDELNGNETEDENVLFQDILPELNRFNLAEAPIPIQNHFIQRHHCLEKHYIEIVSWRRQNYEIWYQFKRESKTAGFKYWINGKDKFKENYQKIPRLTNSDTFYDEVAAILNSAPMVVVERNDADSILQKIEFDISIEEEKPFLKSLFDEITSKLTSDEAITNIDHLNYRDRYTFTKKDRTCVVDFEYNNSGFFGRVLPLKKQCDCPTLLRRIKTIVNQVQGHAHGISEDHAAPEREQTG